MNVLEQLRGDLWGAILHAHGDVHVRLAARDVLDEFIAGYEMVEVDEGRTKTFHGFFLPDDKWYGKSEDRIVRHLTIIVPRAEPPSLLAAAEALDTAVSVLADMGNTTGAVVAWQSIYAARAALAAAIKRARDRDE